MVVLETLQPAERLAFVLHDTFGVSFDIIGRALDRTPNAAKQLAGRARRKIRGADAADCDPKVQRGVVDAFLHAARNGNFDVLIAALAPEVVLQAEQIDAYNNASPQATASIKRVSGLTSTDGTNLGIAPHDTSEPDRRSKVSSPAASSLNGSPKLLSDHLGPEDLERIITACRARIPQQATAEQFRISVSSVRRIWNSASTKAAVLPATGSSSESKDKHRPRRPSPSSTSPIGSADQGVILPSGSSPKD